MSEDLAEEQRIPVKQEIIFEPEVIDPVMVNAAQSLIELQGDYEKAVAELRKENGIHNRGCGPGSFALAVILQKKFDLPIDARLSPGNDESDGIHIVFGLQREGVAWNDHAWVEATHNGQTLMVSHESNSRTFHASFSAIVFNTAALEEAYKVIGFRRTSVEEMRERGIAESQLRGVKNVIGQINDGEIPELYEAWFQCLMTQLR